MQENVIHPFDPVFDSRSRVLILGTMPSPASRSYGFYYGHPRNRFWPVLCELLDEPLPGTPAERRDLVLRHGIALWDVLAGCSIKGASDASIRDAVPNDLRRIADGCTLRAVFTTGKTATRCYERFCRTQIGLPAQVLPSPSPANCAVGMGALLDAYRAILAVL